jgi:hypothetical protein
MALSPRQLEAQCKHRLRAGHKGSDLRTFLMTEGMTESSADALMSKTMDELRSQAGMVIAGGVVLAVIGVVVSITVTKASGGMAQFLWWGPVLIGAALAITGLVNFTKLRRR